ncbi:MAG: hypothetical protein H6891_07780 [Brucellaceae bacterium]|nr:hypothetical protein [Brucellaceae bacterium]
MKGKTMFTSFSAAALAKPCSLSLPLHRPRLCLAPGKPAALYARATPVNRTVSKYYDDQNTGLSPTASSAVGGFRWHWSRSTR